MGNERSSTDDETEQEEIPTQASHEEVAAAIQRLELEAADDDDEDEWFIGS